MYPMRTFVTSVGSLYARDHGKQSVIRTESEVVYDFAALVNILRLVLMRAGYTVLIRRASIEKAR